MTPHQHPVFPTRRTFLRAALVAGLLLPAAAMEQATSGSGSAAANSTAKPATAKQNTTPAAAKPQPIHLSTAYPVQKNSDGTQTLIRPTPAAPKSQPNAQAAAQGTTLATPGTSTSGAAAPETALPPPAPPKPPPPPNPATIAENLSALPPARFNQRTIVIDAAHGGNDSGARIADNILEKDVDLALAFRLKSLLQARGFTVVTTRDNDAATDLGNPGSPLTLDGRAAISNRAGAAACILIHATGSGRGVHLYTSELDPKPGQTVPTPWLTAQAAWLPQSQKLSVELATALARARLPLVSSRASVRPVDSLTCPALVLELGPSDTDPASINDSGYQQRVVAAVAGALIFWQNHVKPPARILPAPPPATSITDAEGTSVQP